MATAHNPSSMGRRTTAGSLGARAMSPAQVAAAVIGVVFLLVGILGFIPGVTENVDNLEAAGNDSAAELFGIFQVSILHNAIHLAFGVLGLLAARTFAAARLYLIGGGVVYLVVTLYGALVDATSDANFVPFNTADNWLHLALGLGMIGLGLILGGRTVRTTEP